MEFCNVCEVRSKCIKICDRLEKFLRQRKIGGYSERHIKRKEILFPTSKLEEVATSRAFQLRFGKKYFKGEFED